MLLKIVIGVLIFGGIAAAFCFNRPRLAAYLNHRQAISESLMIARAIAGKDARVESSGDQGKIWRTSAVSATNNLYLESIRTGDADCVQVGRLLFHKLDAQWSGAGCYYAQSEAASYFLNVTKAVGKIDLSIETHLIEYSVFSQSMASSKPGIFESEPYKTLIKADERRE